MGARSGGTPCPVRHLPAGQRDIGSSVPQKPESPLPCPSQEDTQGGPPCGDMARRGVKVPMQFPCTDLLLHPSPHSSSSCPPLPNPTRFSLHLFQHFPCCKSSPKYCSQLAGKIYRSQITLPAELNPAQHSWGGGQGAAGGGAEPPSILPAAPRPPGMLRGRSRKTKGSRTWGIPVIYSGRSCSINHAVGVVWSGARHAHVLQV